MQFCYYSVRHGRNVFINIAPTKHGWHLQKDGTSGDCNSTGAPILYDMLRMDLVSYPIDLPGYFDHLWTNWGQLSEEKMQSRLNEISTWIIPTEKNRPTSGIFEDYVPDDSPHYTCHLERALQIAVQAHAGQIDKNAEAYIFHPIRVMLRCNTPNARIVALLHDVLEDTAMMPGQLQAEGFSPEVLSALHLVTHEPGVPYDEYIGNLMTDQTAIEVKIADLEDNLDVRRLLQVDDRTLARLRKYILAYRRLTAKRDGQVV